MKLPGVAQEIADVIGRERALYLIGQLPRCIAGVEGRKSSRVILYVPKFLKANHELARILGWHEAKKLVTAFGGEMLQPPNCAEIYRRFRDDSIKQLAQQGMSHRQLSEIMGVGDRHIKNLFRGEKPQVVRPDAANDNAAPFHRVKAA